MGRAERIRDDLLRFAKKRDIPVDTPWRDLTDEQKTDLLATIIDEAERLNRFIANLLDMTRLEAGAIAPNLSLHDVGEIVGSALRRAAMHSRTPSAARPFAMARPMPVLAPVTSAVLPASITSVARMMASTSEWRQP